MHTFMRYFRDVIGMAAFRHNVEEQEEEEEVKKSKKNNVKVQTTLASIECLTIPQVQEIVVLADYRCKMCQERVADIVSRCDGDIESLEIKMMEKKVILTFTRRYSKTSKTLSKKLEVIAIYKNIVNKIPNVRGFLSFSGT